MDQTIEFTAADRRLAIERLCAYLVASVDAAIASDAPFYISRWTAYFPTTSMPPYWSICHRQRIIDRCTAVRRALILPTVRILE